MSPQTINIVLGVATVLLMLVGVIAYFATHRDVERIEKQMAVADGDRKQILDKLDSAETRLDRSNESRMSAIHSRINPLEQQVAHNSGQMDAFTDSFEKFTRIIESTSRQRDDQINAFTKALETFARVLDERKRQ